MTQVNPDSVQVVKNEFSEEFLEQLTDIAHSSVRIYTRAYVFIALIVVLLVVGLGNRPVLWCGLAALATVAIQYYRLKALVGMLHVQRKLLHPTVKKGEKVTLVYSVWNRARGTHPPFLLRDMTMYLRSPTPTVATEYPLRANESIEIKSEKLCEAPTGRFKMAPYALQIFDELGLFQIKMLLTDDLAIEVVEGFTVKSNEALLNPASSPLAGEMETAHVGNGISLFGVREYRDGDPLNSICWKKSVTGNDFFVKEFEADITRRVAVMLSTEAKVHAGYGASATIEIAKSYALHLIRAYLEDHSSVSLLTRSVQFIDASGTPSLGLFEKALTRVQLNARAYTDDDSSSELGLYALHLKPPCLICYITPYVPRTEAETLRQLLYLKSEGFEPTVIFVRIADSADLVSKRFGSFLEFIYPRPRDLTEIVQKFRLAGINAYTIGAQDLNGRIKVRHYVAS